MFWKQSFRINDRTLDDLKRAGLNAPSLKSLRGHVSGSTLGRPAFEAVLASLDGGQTDPAQRKLIHKYSQLSLLRLERLIPNRSTREWVDALIYAVIIAMLVRFFVFAPFKIPSESMYPTIKKGDHIFATRFNYGIPVPFTDIKLWTRSVSRGDIVIFPFPLDPEVDYIKRVVARGGDTLEFKQGLLYLNGEPLEDRENTAARCTQTIVNTWKSNGYEPPCDRLIAVPEGRLFVMGDNRNNSADSRFWGFVEEKTVKGMGWIIFFSHDPDAGWFGGYRLERFASLLR